MGNGINEHHWSATGSGADMQLSKTLSVLEPFKQKVNVIDGLFNRAATGQGIHPAQTGNLLSGAQIQKGAVIRSGRLDRSGDRRPRRSGHPASEPGALLRAADDGLSRDQLLAGLQLAHLVAEPALARAGRGLSVAGVRHPVREPEQPARPQRARPRPRPGAGPDPSDQRRGPRQAGRVSDERAGGRDAGREDASDEGPGGRSGEADQHGRSSPWIVRPTDFQKICASTRG